MRTDERVGHVLGAFSEPHATAESTSSSDNPPEAIAANSEAADMPQSCFDESQISFDPALQDLEHDYDREAPSLLLENDDTSLSSPEEIFWFERGEDDASGLSSEDTSLAGDAFWFLSESFEALVRWED